MCISIPAKTIRQDSDSLLVEARGALRRVLRAPGVQGLDWVLLYGGIAIGDLTEAEALTILETLKIASNSTPESPLV